MIPTYSATALALAGFKYLGTVTVYSHLQACGIINDHGSDCPCYRKIVENYPTVTRRRYLEKQVSYFGDM